MMTDDSEFLTPAGTTGDKYLDGLLSDAGQALSRNLEDSPRSLSTIVDSLLPTLERTMSARRSSQPDRLGESDCGTGDAFLDGLLHQADEALSSNIPGRGILMRIVDSQIARTALEKIVRRYSNVVLGTVRSFKLRDADALDVVQMTWMRLAENIDRIQFPERLGAWLATTARRECLHILRQAEHTEDPVNTVTEVADPSADPERHFIEADAARRLWKLVGQLPPRQRTLLLALFTGNSRPYAEVADRAGIPLGAVGPTRARALQQLRRRLSERPAHEDDEQLQLIETDALIVDRVRQAGEGSREYIELSTTLLEVGVETLANLRKNNLLFPTLQQRRIFVPRPPESWPTNAARVIYLSVRGTVPKFMRFQVLEGGWDPDKKATLKTSFVTASLYRFAKEYLVYYREEMGLHQLDYSVDDVTAFVSRSQNFLEDAATSSRLLDDLLNASSLAHA